MSNFPIWMTQEQADRLKGDIEAAGFSDVAYPPMPWNIAKAPDSLASDQP